MTAGSRSSRASAPAAVDQHTNLLRRGQHVLFIGLLAVGTVRTIQGDRATVWTIVLSAALLTWYLTGLGLARWAPLRRFALFWLLFLVIGWGGLVVGSVDYVWVAFSLFLLTMELLSPVWGIPAVCLLVIAVLFGLGWHRNGLDAASTLGPLFGAAIAVVIMLVYRELRREAEHRARLLAKLTEAQSRMSAAERQAGVLAERERLAREIHDTVAQSLSTIVLLLRTAAGAWQAAPAPARKQLGAAESAARGALEDTRRLIRALGPVELEGRPLTEALTRLTQRFRKSGLDADFTTDGEPYALPTTVEVVLLRVAQEALANVRKHAEATRVNLTLTYLSDSVRMDLVDNGVGFSPRPVERHDAKVEGDGIGLGSMRGRLEQVGGTLVVESEPGHGTAVSASVPSEPDTDNDSVGEQRA